MSTAKYGKINNLFPDYATALLVRATVYCISHLLSSRQGMAGSRWHGC